MWNFLKRRGTVLTKARKWITLDDVMFPLDQFESVSEALDRYNPTQGRSTTIVLREPHGTRYQLNCNVPAAMIIDEVRTAQENKSKLVA